MAWIESHQELGRHPKTKRLARALQISLPTTVGHLHFLWWWATDYAQDGDLSKYANEDIADAMGWEGDAKEAVDALLHSGYLDQEQDGVLLLHDWHEYAGRLIEQRKAQAEYKQRQYALYNDLRLTRAIKQRDGDTCQYCGKTVNWNDRRGIDGGTYDHIDPHGDNAIDNIVVCCRSCNSKKGARTPKQAKMPFISGSYTLDNGNEQLDTGSNTADTGRYTADKSTITEPDLDLTEPDIKDLKDLPPLPPASGGTDDTTSEPASERLTDEMTAGTGTPANEAKTLQEKRFDEFWEAYPDCRKVGKGAARKSWNKVKPSAELHTKILAALDRAKQGRQWVRENGQFIPNPTTWLNQERWDDGPPQEERTQENERAGFDMAGFRNALDRYDDDGREITPAGERPPPEQPHPEQ
jgi:hypothetical protein